MAYWTCITYAAGRMLDRIPQGAVLVKLGAAIFTFPCHALL